MFEFDWLEVLPFFTLLELTVISCPTSSLENAIWEIAVKCERTLKSRKPFKRFLDAKTVTLPIQIVLIEKLYLQTELVF